MGGKDGVGENYVCVWIPHGLATEEGTVITWIASSEMGVILHAINAEHWGGEGGGGRKERPQALGLRESAIF